MALVSEWEGSPDTAGGGAHSQTLSSRVWGVPLPRQIRVLLEGPQAERAPFAPTSSPSSSVGTGRTGGGERRHHLPVNMLLPPLRGGEAETRRRSLPLPGEPALLRHSLSGRDLAFPHGGGGGRERPLSAPDWSPQKAVAWSSFPGLARQPGEGWEGPVGEPQGEERGAPRSRPSLALS